MIAQVGSAAAQQSGSSMDQSNTGAQMGTSQSGATSTTPSQSGTGSAIGSQAGEAGSQAGEAGAAQSTTPGSGQMGTAAAGSSDQVRNDIQTAFRNEPTLTSSNISVNVSDDSVQLAGSAPSQKDRDEAKRIAQSFAGNRKVVDNIEVSGNAVGSESSSTPSSTNPNSSNPNSVGSSTNNTTNPEQPQVPKK